MKIVVVSPSERHLREVSAMLEATHHQVSCHEGGKSRLRALVEQEHPDLVLADGMCCDPAELAQVEFVTTHYPRTAVVLMCSSVTPDFLLHSMRAGVREVLTSPAPTDALQAAVQRVAAKLAGGRGREPGRIIAFLPCKGGAGATFIAGNVAWELAQSRSVLLVDLNLQFGDALSLVHDGHAPTTVADLAASIDRLDASLLGASTIKVLPTLGVLAAPEDPGRALEVKAEDVDAILALAVNHYDFVVVDMPRTLDTMAIKVLDRAWRVFPVLQPTLPSVRHAYKLLEVFRSLGYAAEKVEAIVNAYDPRGEIDLEHVKRSLRTTRLFTIPDACREVTASVNRGEPLVHSARSNPVARQLIELVLSLNPKQEEQKGLLGRLFRRA